MVGKPGNLGEQLINSSAGDPLLSHLCSQFRLWHADLILPGVPSECVIAILTILTAHSASPFDWGEYADDRSWLIPASTAYALIALLVVPNCRPPSVVKSKGGP